MIHLVSGGKSGTRKRPRSRRKGLWASWLGDEESSSKPRTMRRGLRRVPKQTITSMDTGDMVGVLELGEDEIGTMAKEFKTMGIVSQEQTDDAQVQEMDISSPFNSAQRRNRSWGWEWEENIWLMQVALSMGGKVLDDFLEIEEQLGDIQEVFGQEICDHQHLKQWQEYL